MKSPIQFLSTFFTAFFSPHRPGSRTNEKTPTLPDMMLNMIATTEEHEIDCAEAFELLHQYADMLDRGENAEKLLPLLKRHIDICRDCREELEALLSAIHSGRPAAAGKRRP